MSYTKEEELKSKLEDMKKLKRVLNIKTTEEEFMAISALVIKAYNKYGKLYDTENQYKLAKQWIGKALKEIKEKNRREYRLKKIFKFKIVRNK